MAAELCPNPNEELLGSQVKIKKEKKCLLREVASALRLRYDLGPGFTAIHHKQAKSAQLQALFSLYKSSLKNFTKPLQQTLTLAS